MPNQLVVSTSPTLPVFTNRLHIMPTRSGQSYSIEWRPQSEQQIKAATTENNDKSFASDRQRRLQNRGKGQLANPKENFWRVITRLLYIIPKLVDVLKTPGLACMQYFCSGSVICIIVLCLVLLYSVKEFFGSSNINALCVLASNENCQALARHAEALALATSNVNAHTLKQTGMAASAGTLGYHGPFADVILSAMPNTKSVTNGFWTRPFATHTAVSTLPSTRTLSIVHNVDATVRSNLPVNITTNRANANAVHTE